MPQALKPFAVLGITTFLAVMENAALVFAAIFALVILSEGLSTRAGQAAT